MQESHGNGNYTETSFIGHFMHIFSIFENACSIWIIDTSLDIAWNLILIHQNLSFWVSTLHSIKQRNFFFGHQMNNAKACFGRRKQSPLFWLIYIWFGTWKVRRFKQAWVRDITWPIQTAYTHIKQSVLT